MQRPRMRAAAVVLGLPLAVTTGAAGGTLLDNLGSPTAVTVLAAILPVAVYGWIANRWWAALPLPVTLGTAYLLALRIIDWKTGGCSVCGEDEDWSNAPYWFAFTLVLPVMFVLALAVGAHRARDAGGRARDRRQTV